MSYLLRGRVRFTWPGLIVDVLLLVGNGLLTRPIARAIETAERMTLAWVLLAAVLAQLASALLKRGPLHARLAVPAKGKEKESRDGLAGCLTLTSLMPLGLMAMMGFFLLFRQGSGQLSGSGINATVLLGSVALTGLVASMLYMAITPNRPLPWRRLYGLFDLVGNLLVLFSALVFMAFFWQALWSFLGPVGEPSLDFVRIVLAFGASFILALLYVPIRALLLVEDFAYPFTWFRMWLVTLPLVLNALF